ncbi:MAG TPA: biotin/lipoyl-containing protein [Polyangiaceae bacterium]|nr:biotin/lipoyl-containing protein [Polyangiaceae bacterium]
MRYFVTLGQREVPVDVKPLPDGRWNVEIAGQKLDVDACSVEGALSLRIDGRVVDLTFASASPEVSYAGLGARGTAIVETDRSRAQTSSRQKSAGTRGQGVSAPMPGRIVRVLVAKGDSVALGAPLVVIEAMKMENELRALHAATIAEVLVKPGDTVESGAKLVVFG